MKTNSFTSNSKYPGLGKLIFKLSLFLPVLFSIILINYYVDPASIYHGARLYDCYSEALSSGKNVAGFRNMDERIVKARTLEALTKAPDIAIFGSSRAMMLGEPAFPGHTVFNSSVSGAVFKDVLGLFYKYVEKESYPKVVILGMDPWLFNDNVIESRWESISSEYKKMLIELGDEPGHDELSFIPEKYLNLISLSYLSKSVEKLRSSRKEKKKDKHSSACIVTDQTISDDVAMVLHDGRHVYDKAYREKSIPMVEAEAIKYATQNPVYHLEGFTEFSEAKATILSRFLNFLKQKNIKVAFYLDPYHPTTYRLLLENPKTRIIEEVEQKIRKIAEGRNIPVIGSYDPDDYGLTPEFFYDGMHTKPDADAKVIESQRMKINELFAPDSKSNP